MNAPPKNNNNGGHRPRGETLRALINRRAEENADAPFLILPGGGLFTYGEWRDSLLSLAGFFAQTPPGEVVAAMAANGIAAAQTLLGAPYHGRVAFVINLSAGDAQIAYKLRHSQCLLATADEANISRLQKIVADESLPVQIVKATENGIPPQPPAKTKSGGDNGNNNGDGNGNGDGYNYENPENPALLIYTSGTTGKPKGVLHSHKSLIAGGQNTVIAHNLGAADRALCVLPLFHINGQCVTVFAPLASGGSVVLPPKFSATHFWKWADENDCTWFSAVPTILSHLLHQPPPPRTPPLLRFGRSASSALPPETHRQFEKRFGLKLMETMGLTETAAQILSNPMPPAQSKFGSPGIAFGNEVAIVNEKGKEQPRGEEGEIAVRGENVMLGYLRDETATAAAFAPEGWFLSGDLGRMDEDGFVFVTGRRKELIIKGGENIAPREIDDALHLAPNVVEAAAFARPCKIYGQRVEAAVVLSAPEAHDEKELMELCRREVGKFKSPDRIHFLPELPKGPSGKVQRLKLAAQFNKE